MKIYLRLLKYCFPLSKRVIPFSIFTFFQVIFGILNFTLLIPLLNVLFGTVDNTALKGMLTVPDFSLSIDYFKHLFNYYFASSILEYGRFAALQFVTAIVVVSVILTNLFRYLTSVQIELLKLQIIRNLRNALYEKILKMEMGFFTNSRKGDIMGKVTNDVTAIEGSISTSIAALLKEPFTLITFFVLLLSLSVKLTLFTLVVIPISGIIISWINKKIKKTASESYVAFGKLIGLIDETLSGMRLIKAFNGERYILNKFRAENDNYTRLSRKMNLKRELASPFSELSGVLVVSFILIYGGSLVLSNQSELTASEFVGYIILFSQILRPAKAISTSISTIQVGIAAGERVLSVIDLKSTITDGASSLEVKQFNNQIEFKNVSFSYSEKDVLKNLNFTIEAGKMVALVGPSGGGKTTISDLVPRFYDVKSGEILLDDVNIKDIRMESLRSMMGIVTQESILFNDTIYNNILFGNENATQEDVENAAKIANAHEFIIKTDNGYHSEVGDRGVKLSGGQKQRICIARAVLANPPIMILDEATSALDTESEKLVQQALDNLMKNRTSLVIAHRLSTIQNADKILVIKDGTIVEQGNHEALIARPDGLYKKLQMMQSV
ncbi:MAG: ABC transporter ATP-binding protein [Cytophagales bacterium]